MIFLRIRRGIYLTFGPIGQSHMSIGEPINQSTTKLNSLELVGGSYGLGKCFAWEVVCGRTVSPYPHTHSTRDLFLFTCACFNFSHSHGGKVVLLLTHKFWHFSSRRELGEWPYPHDFVVCVFLFMLWVWVCEFTSMRVVFLSSCI